jgi:hypothetical protein
MSLYLTLSTLYFMFVNRVDVYKKLFLDPLIKGVSWTTFRSNPFVSGRDAAYTIRMPILPLYVFPFLVSTISLVACAYTYRGQIFALSFQDVALKISFVITALLFIYTGFVFARYSRFARRWLYLVPSAEQTDPQTEALLHKLFRSIAPGCVRQPNSFRTH